jgi:hypothetical protein
MKTFISILMTLTIILGLCACKNHKGNIPTPTRKVIINNMEQARDVAVEYLSRKNNLVSSNEWISINDTIINPPGPTRFLYASGSWLVRVTEVKDKIGNTVYSVQIDYVEKSLSWKGQIDIYGQLIFEPYQRQAYVDSPDHARDSAIAYLVRIYKYPKPGEWTSESPKIDSSGITIWIYATQDWQVEVAAPASTTTSKVVLYQVTVKYIPELLQWGGFIDAYGQVIEKYVRQIS